jgi:regulator of nucleoside diphosphate kinase
VPTISISNVTIPASDHRRLERLAQIAAEQGDMDALFLMGEIDRAEVVPDLAARLDSVVTMGSWVTFWTNWERTRETRQLVYPEDYMSDQSQIPVLSPLGAALVGLKVGGEVPFFAEGCTNVVRVENVSRRGPNDGVTLPFRGPLVKDEQCFDDDPGPRAA